MRRRLRFTLFLTIVPFLVLLSSTAFAQLQPFFEDELEICDRVEQARAEGQTLKEALTSLIQSFQSNDPNVLNSIRRDILTNAILVCRYDAATVIEAAFQAEIPIELVIEVAVAAGVEESVITATLSGLGVDSDMMASVIDLVRVPLMVDLILPPPFTVGSGLGQASPFTP